MTDVGTVASVANADTVLPHNHESVANIDLALSAHCCTFTVLIGTSSCARDTLVVIGSVKLLPHEYRDILPLGHCTVFEQVRVPEKISALPAG